MFCSNCGHKIDDDSKFCGECGATTSAGINQADENHENNSQSQVVDTTVEVLEPGASDSLEGTVIEVEQPANQVPVQSATQMVEQKVASKVTETSPSEKTSTKKKPIGLFVGVGVVLALIVVCIGYIQFSSFKLPATEELTKKQVLASLSEDINVNGVHIKISVPESVIESYAKAFIEDNAKVEVMDSYLDLENNKYYFIVKKGLRYSFVTDITIKASNDVEITLSNPRLGAMELPALFVGKGLMEDVFGGPKMELEMDNNLVPDELSYKSFDYSDEGKISINLDIRQSLINETYELINYGVTDTYIEWFKDEEGVDEAIELFNNDEKAIKEALIKSFFGDQKLLQNVLILMDSYYLDELSLKFGDQLKIDFDAIKTKQAEGKIRDIKEYAEKGIELINSYFAESEEKPLIFKSQLYSLEKGEFFDLGNYYDEIPEDYLYSLIPIYDSIEDQVGIVYSDYYEDESFLFVKGKTIPLGTEADATERYGELYPYLSVGYLNYYQDDLDSLVREKYSIDTFFVNYLSISDESAYMVFTNLSGERYNVAFMNYGGAWEILTDEIGDIYTFNKDNPDFNPSVFSKAQLNYGDKVKLLSDGDKQTLLEYLTQEGYIYDDETVVYAAQLEGEKYTYCMTSMEYEYLIDSTSGETVIYDSYYDDFTQIMGESISMVGVQYLSDNSSY